MSVFQPGVFQPNVFQISTTGPYPATASFNGAGDLNTAPRIRAVASVLFVGAGVLQAFYVPQITASASFAGAGALNAATRIHAAASVSSMAASNLDATAGVQAAASALFDGTSALQASFGPQVPGTTSFIGTGALTSAAIVRAAASTSFAGAGVLSADAIVRVPVPLSVIFAGTGTLSAATRVRAAAAASFAGASTVNASVTRIRAAASAILIGTGALTPRENTRTSISAIFAGKGTLAEVIKLSGITSSTARRRYASSKAPDIRLVQNNLFPNSPHYSVTMDWSLRDDGSLDDTQSLATAVIVALGTDALADVGEPLPDPDSTDRAGWWGDLDAEEVWNGWPIGSKLWLLKRSKITGSEALEGATVERVEQYIREAMQPFLDRRVGSSLEVAAARVNRDQINAVVRLYRGPNIEVDLSYQILWEEIVPVSPMVPYYSGGLPWGAR